KGPGALSREVKEVGPVEEWRRLCEHALLDVTPKMRHRLVRIVQKDLTVTALSDLIAPALEGLAQDRRPTGAHQVEGRQNVDRPHVGRRGIDRREGEPPRERGRDARVA